MVKICHIRANYAEIEKFRLPVYNPKSVDKCVTYYVLDPDSVVDGNPRLKRMRKKFSSIKSKKERDECALRFCDELTAKLKSGWNPLIQQSTRNSFATMEDIFSRYTLYINKALKVNQLTRKTFVDYQNRLKMLQSYLAEFNPINYVYQFDKVYIEAFLDYIFIDRDAKPRTRNNYLTWLSSFCSWLVEHGYLDGNPCQSIKSLRNTDKIRQSLNARDLAKLNSYLEEKNLFFLLACNIQYYTLIRPNEMSYIRIGDISVSEQTIFVSKDVSKNHRDGKVTLPKIVIQLMIKLGVLSYPSNYYLFGRHFHPSEVRADSRIFREEWANVRKALNFPSTYQFYSLKDTGISDAINKVGIVVVKDQARHQDIQTTNKYIRKEQLTAHQELKDYQGNL